MKSFWLAFLHNDCTCVLKENCLSKVTPNNFSSLLSLIVVLPIFIDKLLHFFTENHQVALFAV